MYFRKDLWRYLSAWMLDPAPFDPRRRIERLAWALVIGTIPGAIAGAAFEDIIQEHLGAPWLIAVMLAVVRRGALRGRQARTVGSRHGLDRRADAGSGSGVAQAVALQPGVSRSGITMTAARWIGIDRGVGGALLVPAGLPIIAGAGLFKGIDLAKTGFQGYAAQFFWGFVSSAISGFLVIWGLLDYLRRHTSRRSCTTGSRWRRWCS